MRIGLFSDVSDKSLNGVTHVVASTKNELEKMGHKVFLFCPANDLKIKVTTSKIKDNLKDKLKFDNQNTVKDSVDETVFEIPSTKGIIFKDFRAPIYVPKHLLNKIEKLNLDIIHFVTPGQVGALGIYASKKLNIPLIGQHTTDLYQYIGYYKKAIPIPYIAAPILPFITNLSKEMKIDLLKSYIPKMNSVKNLTGKLLGIIYDNCNICICVSKKSKNQLEQFSYGNAHFEVLPTGVNAFHKVNKSQISIFKKKYEIEKNDKVLIYAGRLSQEKNLPFLISVIENIIKDNKKVKLLFAGDFEYRKVLEHIANNSSAKDNIIFTGRLKKDDLALAYNLSTIFVFPSMTDTQGLVLTEAAHCGLPIVLIDKEVSEVVKDGKNGYISDGTIYDFSNKINTLLNNKKIYSTFSKNSKEIAGKFTEKSQTEKLVKIYNTVNKNI